MPRPSSTSFRGSVTLLWSPGGQVLIVPGATRRHMLNRCARSGERNAFLLSSLSITPLILISCEWICRTYHSFPPPRSLPSPLFASLLRALSAPARVQFAILRPIWFALHDFLAVTGPFYSPQIIFPRSSDDSIAVSVT